ncbi:GGDEF domain-containing protein, partial [Candidatus Woesearchaeota archaeon]|nr:GGDEF domain-containing protein [Candidatus Woesearchaeota archaeon]
MDDFFKRLQKEHPELAKEFLRRVNYAYHTGARDLGAVIIEEISGKNTDIPSFSGIFPFDLEGSSKKVRNETAKYGKQIKQLVSTDALTGVPNRGYLDKHLPGKIREAGSLGVPISFTLMDLDFFKDVNDNYGHQAGDDVLKRVGSCMREELRPYDLFGRYGGEEFYFTTVGPAKDDVFGVAQRLHERIGNEEFSFSGEKVKVTASMGICYCDEVEELNFVPLEFEKETKETYQNRAERLKKVADNQLYVAKNEGRNAIAISDLDGILSEIYRP